MDAPAPQAAPPLPRLLRLVSWNIGTRGLFKVLNGEAVDNKRGAAFKCLGDVVKHFDAPDILCLQEVKLAPKDAKLTSYAQMTTAPGYASFFSVHNDGCDRTGRDGVLTLVSQRLVTPGLRVYRNLLALSVGPDGRLVAAPKEGASAGSASPVSPTSPTALLVGDGRTLILDFGPFVVFNMYMPARGQPDAVHRQTAPTAKRDFHLAVQRLAAGLLAAGRDVVVCGDLNVTHTQYDLQDMAAWIKEHPGETFSKGPFRQWMDVMLGCGGVRSMGDEGWVASLPHDAGGPPPVADTSGAAAEAQGAGGGGAAAASSSETRDDSESARGAAATAGAATSSASAAATDAAGPCAADPVAAPPPGPCMVDTLRVYVPPPKPIFTFWPLAQNGREDRRRHFGARLDYVLVPSSWVFVGAAGAASDCAAAGGTVAPLVSPEVVPTSPCVLDAGVIPGLVELDHAPVTLAFVHPGTPSLLTQGLSSSSSSSSSSSGPTHPEAFNPMRGQASIRAMFSSTGGGGAKAKPPVETAPASAASGGATDSDSRIVVAAAAATSSAASPAAPFPAAPATAAAAAAAAASSDEEDIVCLSEPLSTTRSASAATSDRSGDKGWPAKVSTTSGGKRGGGAPATLFQIGFVQKPVATESSSGEEPAAAAVAAPAAAAAPAPASSSSSSSSSSASGINAFALMRSMAAVRCEKCGASMERKVSNQDGSRGESFYSCGKCNTFKWQKAVLAEASKGAGSGGASKTSSNSGEGGQPPAAKRPRL